MHISVWDRDFGFGSSPKRENAEISIKIDVLSRVNIPFVQEEMTLCLIENNAKIGFLTDDHDLRDSAEQFDIVRRRALNVILLWRT